MQIIRKGAPIYVLGTLTLKKSADAQSDGRLSSNSSMESYSRRLAGSDKVWASPTKYVMQYVWVKDIVNTYLTSPYRMSLLDLLEVVLNLCPLLLVLHPRQPLVRMELKADLSVS